MPMLDLDIAKTKTHIDELRFSIEQARKSGDKKKEKELEEKHKTALLKLRSLQSKKASAAQNGRYLRGEHGRGEVPHPEIPYRPVGPMQVVGGSAVQGVVVKMRARKKKRKEQKKKHVSPKKPKSVKRRKK